MAVMLNCGAIFLHVPKTGGSWVTQVLREQGLVRKEFSHIHADMVRARYYAGGARVATRSSYEWLKSRVPRSWKAMRAVQRLKKTGEAISDARFPYCFCFVRHPLDWYESWWRYMCGRSGAHWAAESDLTSWHPCGRLRTLGDPDFATFVQNVNSVSPGFVTELFGLYTQPGIQFIGRQESLVDDLVTVLQRLDVRFDEQQLRESQRVNTSRMQLRTEWPAELRSETERLEFAGLVRYGYVESPVLRRESLVADQTR